MDFMSLVQTKWQIEELDLQWNSLLHCVHKTRRDKIPVKAIILNPSTLNAKATKHNNSQWIWTERGQICVPCLCDLSQQQLHYCTILHFIYCSEASTFCFLFELVRCLMSDVFQLQQLISFHPWLMFNIHEEQYFVRFSNQ